MFYSLKGKLIHTEHGFAVVECGGVGFKCRITINTHRSLPEIGSEVQLYTYLNVREDSLDLFGFYTLNELNCYKMLTNVSGVGPKVGIAILSELSAEKVAIAIAGNDPKTLTKASGVGPKLAQRIILELKDKFKNTEVINKNDVPVGAISTSENISSAITALTVLGYSSSDAAQVLATLDSQLPVEKLISLALKSLASGRF